MDTLLYYWRAFDLFTLPIDGEMSVREKLNYNCSKGNLSYVKFMLEYHKDHISIYDNNDEALNYVLESGNRELFLYMLDNYSDLLTRGNIQKNIHFACKSDNLLFVKYIFEQLFNTSLITIDCLTSAIHNKRLEIIKYLLDTKPGILYSFTADMYYSMNLYRDTSIRDYFVDHVLINNMVFLPGGIYLVRPELGRIPHEKTWLYGSGRIYVYTRYIDIKPNEYYQRYVDNALSKSDPRPRILTLQ